MTARTNPRDERIATATKLAATTGIISNPTNTARTGCIALYFLNLNAYLRRADILARKSILKRFIVFFSLRIDIFPPSKADGARAYFHYTTFVDYFKYFEINF